MPSVRMFFLLFAVLYLVGCGNQHQAGVEKALAEDSRNEGIVVRVHVSGDKLTFDLIEVPGDKSRLDVSRVLMQAAKQIYSETEQPYSEVILAFRGEERFKFTGTYFRQLGEEYGDQNPVYTLRTLPQNVLNLDGTQAFSTWEGGLIGVTGKQMDDLNKFHDRWYMDDLVKEL